MTSHPLLAFVALLLLSACQEPTPSTDGPPPEVGLPPELPIPESATAAGLNADDEGWQRVRIEGFECGDNCYLIVRPTEGESREMSALCVADACADWNAAVAIPDDWIDRVVEVTFGTGAQLDGGGTVMDPAYLTVTAIRPLDA